MISNPAILALAAWLLPALSFLVLAIVYPLRRLGKPAAWFSTLCAAAAVVSAFLAWNITSTAAEPLRVVWPWLPSGGVTIADVGVLVDAQSSVMLCLVTLVSFLVQFYSLGYLHDEPPPSLGRYYAYQSLFAFSMIGLALSPNLLQLFMCWELVGLCSYLLIGYWYQRPSAARAAVKAFWITKAGDVGLLIGIVMLWRLTGTFDFGQLRMMATSGAIPVAGLSLITFAIYMGAMGKSAQFPFHVWLPDAMEGPTPVSALIHAATMVTAGVYLLVRTDWLFALTPNVLAIVAWIGAFTALLAAVLACVQDDIKRVLAYSTGVAAGLHDDRDRGRRRDRGLPAPVDARAVQGTALPRRGRRHSRGWQQRSAAHGWPVPKNAADRAAVHRRHAVARGHPAVRRVPVEGRNSRRGVDGWTAGAVRAAHVGGVPHGVLHVPCRLPRLLRDAGACGRSCPCGACGCGGDRRNSAARRPRPSA
jgi:NADH:ubiquinone oxidoreductase subunit K